jgi:hypothetical protein
MEKEFIPYEQALALKELGFDEPCFGLWNLNNGKYEVDIIGVCKYSKEFKHREVLAPTFSQSFRWFREKYGIHSTIHLLIINPKIYESSIKNDLGEIVLMKEFNTYEKAELECLVKMIDIVKKQPKFKK